MVHKKKVIKKINNDDDGESTMKLNIKKKAAPPEISLRKYVKSKASGNPSIFKNDFKINRDKSTKADKILEENTEISRNHAKIILLDSGFYIQDEGSANRTYLMADHDRDFPIQEGDEFSLGKTLFKIERISLNKSIKMIAHINYTEEENEQSLTLTFKNDSLTFPSKKDMKFLVDDKDLEPDIVTFSFDEKLMIKANKENK